MTIMNPRQGKYDSLFLQIMKPLEIFYLRLCLST